MSDIVVCKFGGSSVASAAQIRKMRDIVGNDAQRRIVVVSAPGRSKSGEEKVTDHLLNIATEGAHFRDQRMRTTAEESKAFVRERFADIIKELKVDGRALLSALAQDLDTTLTGDKRVAFLASRGEHYNARVIAAYFASAGMAAKACLPEECGFIVTDDYLNAKVCPETYDNLVALTDEQEILVMPGFYGVTSEGDVAVFSRGGSDLTGGEVAYAIHANMYENWTDVSGVFETDPRLIPEARTIPRLTFKEIRLLSSKGFNVFHLDAMLHCRERNIPINIRNTNAPKEAGTVILRERVPEEGVVGIARLDNMAYIYLEKDMLGEELGFTAELLGIFREFGISTYHYPTDRDDIAVLVDQDSLTGAINDLRDEIDRRLAPDNMEVYYNLSILTPVGLGLKGNSFPLVRALQALGEAHISIDMIDQSPSQICFHIGVQQAVADDAIRILYDTLIGR